ncbi:hypothetical protein D3C80_2242290 [compost metagenome]
MLLVSRLIRSFFFKKKKEAIGGKKEKSVISHEQPQAFVFGRADPLLGNVCDDGRV